MTMNFEESKAWATAYDEAYPVAPALSPDEANRIVKERYRRITEIRKLENACFLLDYWNNKETSNEIEKVAKNRMLNKINNLIDELEEKIVSREATR